MKKFSKAFLCMLICLFTLLINQNVKAETYNGNNKVYKIGVIEFAKYVELNEDGELEGYYIDFFDLIGKELNLKYEYVAVNNSEAISKLESGELDFCLGITITESRAEKVVFNSFPIALEKYALYTDQDIDSTNLNKLNGLRFGAIKERAADWILDFFKASNIHVKIVFGESYDEINKLMDNGSIDLLLDSAYKDTTYNKIYEFVASQVYIAANNNNKDLLNNIDDAIVQLNRDGNKIDHLYSSYFDLEKLKKEKIETVLDLLAKIIFFIVVLIILYPLVRKKLYRDYIKKCIKTKRFSIYYDPIYKAKSEEIVGYEAIVKDNIKNKCLENSKEILAAVKENHSISDLCIWKLKTIITDYTEFKACHSFIKSDFYLSLNMPINQFENHKFVDRLIDILNKSKLNKHTICIELSGNIIPKNMGIINDSIKRLKDAGVLIAIDNFGIEYSNLNLISELDLDIIKIDRTFTSNMDKSIIKNEIIMFISRIGKAQNKCVVLEGIDHLEQDKKIKEIDNDQLFVQGSFYGKPITIEEIKKSRS